MCYWLSCKQCTDAHNDAQGQVGDGIQEVTQRGPQGILQQGQVDGQVHDGIQEVTQSGPQEILQQGQADGQVHDGDGQVHDGDDGRTTTCYIGQTGRTLHARSKNHFDGLRKGDPKCPLFKHVVNSHNSDRNPNLFQIKKLCSSRTNLHRLISESEYIQNNVSNGLMNSKSEYRNTKIIRMKTHRTIV